MRAYIAITLLKKACLNKSLNMSEITRQCTKK